jgi:transposase
MLRMIDRHAVQQMLTAGVRIGEVARYFEVSRRTIERICKEPEGAVARWKRGCGQASSLLLGAHACCVAPRVEIRPSDPRLAR